MSVTSWVDSPPDHLHGIKMTMTIKLWLNKILQFVLNDKWDAHPGFIKLSGLLTKVFILSIFAMDTKQ